MKEGEVSEGGGKVCSAVAIIGGHRGLWYSSMSWLTKDLFTSKYWNC